MGDMADDLMDRMENSELTVLDLETNESFTIQGVDYMYNKKYWDEKRYKIIEGD